MTRRFGIDVGGVITDRVNDRADTSFFSDNFLSTTAVGGAFDAIATIVRTLGRENVFVISKCGPAVQAKTGKWLEHHRFFDVTGMDPQNLHFCRTREEKTPICARLGITDFVDDRIDVLRFMDGVVARRFLFAPKPWSHPPGGLTAVANWAEVLAKAGIAA
ncbi:MAG TPA: hypothetical protein VHZ78_02795 [Rhizomicrobium sp.]|nr:hypothetical protein [Rhizomicrobium sp.]